MSARRLLNLVYGLIVEGMDEQETKEFDASLNRTPVKRQETRLATITAIGGEIA